MLEIVQQASFRMLSLELLSKYNRLGNALQFRITWGRKNRGLLATLAVKQVNPQDTGTLFQFTIHYIVQKFNSFIHWMNHYVQKMNQFDFTALINLIAIYPVDSAIINNLGLVVRVGIELGITPFQVWC